MFLLFFYFTASFVLVLCNLVISKQLPIIATTRYAMDP